MRSLVVTFVPVIMIPLFTEPLAIAWTQLVMSMAKSPLYAVPLPGVQSATDPHFHQRLRVESAGYHGAVAVFPLAAFL